MRARVQAQPSQVLRRYHQVRLARRRMQQCPPNAHRGDTGTSRLGRSRAATQPTSRPAARTTSRSRPPARPEDWLARSPTGVGRRRGETEPTTPICAPSVMPRGIASGPSRWNRPASRGPSTATPAVAPTDSQKPIEWTSSGSTSTRPVTARDSSRDGALSRPNTNAVAEIAAIVPARTIDGSNRVRLTNHAINATVAAHRQPARRRRKSGPAPASTNATFWPETAVRCESPLARKRSIIACG